MSVTIKLPQAELMGFLRGNCSEKVHKKVKQLRRDYPEYGMLLEMAENACQDRAIDLNTDPPDRMISGEDIQQLLDDIYTWNASRENKQQFIEYLFHSEKFYEMLMTDFLEAEEVMTMAKEFPVIEELPVGRDDLELLRAAGILREKEPAWEKIRSMVRRLKVDLKKLSGRFLAGLKKLQRMIESSPRVGIPMALTFVISCSNVSRVSYLYYASPYRDRQINAEPFDYDQTLLAQVFTDLPANLRSSEVINKEAFLRDYHQTGWALRTLLPVFHKQEYHIFLENAEREQSRIATLENEIEKMTHAANLPDSLRRKLPSAQGMVHAFYLHSGISGLALYLNPDKATEGTSRRDYLYQAVRDLEKAKTLAGEYGFSSRNQETYFLGMAYGYFYEAEKNRQAIANFSEITPDSEFYERAQKLKDWLE